MHYYTGGRPLVMYMSDLVTLERPSVCDDAVRASGFEMINEVQWDSLSGLFCQTYYLPIGFYFMAVV